MQQQQQQSALAERDTLLHRKPAAATSATTTTTTTISDGIEHDARPDKRSDEWTGKSGKGFIVDNVRRRFSSRGQSGAYRPVRRHLPRPIQRERY